MKTDRLKELEKMVEKLGIGQNREVECVSCHRKILFRDAILLTNKETISHLCSECNDRLIKGELTKKEIDQDELLKRIQKITDDNKQNVPYTPGPDEYPWKKIEEPWVMPYTGGTGGAITYKMYTTTAGTQTNGINYLLKLDPHNYAY